MTIDQESLAIAIERLNESVRVMKRNTAMMSMQLGEYRPLVRLMIKLGLIVDWLDP